MEGEEAPLTLDLRDLRVVSVLGRGAKGVAFHVRHGTHTLALKAISKASIERKKAGDSFRRIWFERDVLSTLQHPLLPKLCGFVVTEKIVGFAIQLCSGGDLSSLRKKQTEKMFSDEIIRFYAAELVLALEYLHGLGIAYRDLKPENIMIQENGHLMLIDFDLSAKLSPKSPDSSHKTSNSEPICRKKKSRTSFLRCLSRQTSPAPAETSSSSDSKRDSDSEKSNSFVGTEDYVAPEIISGKGHDFSVDWWSLGVVLYEMLYGRTPFRGCNRKETFYRILTKSPELVGEPTPLRDLIGRLLEKEPLKRISLEGIKGHAFFRGVDWENVPRISRPPFIPADGAEKEMEGNSGIDIEEFVQSIFGGEESGKEKSFGKENNGGVWVDALSCAPENNDQFFNF